MELRYLTKQKRFEHVDIAYTLSPVHCDRTRRLPGRSAQQADIDRFCRKIKLPTTIGMCIFSCRCCWRYYKRCKINENFCFRVCLKALHVLCE